MHLLCIFLYDSRYLEDFLEVLIREENEEVFVSNVEELKEVLALKLLLFKKLQMTIGRERKEPKLIFALVNREKKNRADG